MTNSILGHTEQLIAAIDRKGILFQTFAFSLHETFRNVRFPKKHINELITAPKFSLPKFGQFYRPQSEIQPFINGNPKDCPHYGLRDEFNMLRHPPFKQFVLEFDGFDQTDARTITVPKFLKYVVLCTKVDIKYQDIDAPGIHVMSFGYNDKPQYIGNTTIRPGWTTYGVTFGIAAQSEDMLVQSKYNPEGFHIRALATGTELDKISNSIKDDYYYGAVAKMMWLEVRALLQFVNVINKREKNGVITTDHVRPRKTTISGRNIGFKYTVLEIDHKTPVNQRGKWKGGTHASPRQHIRRACFRTLKSGKRVFVREHRVGSNKLGVIVKDYDVT